MAHNAPELPFAIALKVLATVISRPVPDRAVLDCGHKMIGLSTSGDLPGIVAPAGAVVSRLSSEHGTLALQGEACGLAIGDKVELVPWYYGSAVNANDHYIGVRGGRVECVWHIAARGAHQ
jgi:D-serine deaminase-like pyridoxal phosphate-dependent protein